MKSGGMLLFMFFLSFSASAGSNNEIDHLLNFVASTNCKYERNGEIYSGAEAVKHIKKKYDYFSNDIETAEDFVKYSATKSKFSGDHYRIHCASHPAVKSSVWLLSELARYRASKK